VIQKALAHENNGSGIQVHCSSSKPATQPSKVRGTREIAPFEEGGHSVVTQLGYYSFG
jgi:hypothetical protein